jgi:hypothetical protein
MGSDPEINNFYSSNQGGLCKKKDEPAGSGSSKSMKQLEAELQGKLHNARVVRSGRAQELIAAATQGVLNAATRGD